jgi:O-antigen/teichoic acid export membrane protein
MILLLRELKRAVKSVTIRIRHLLFRQGRILPDAQSHSNERNKRALVTGSFAAIARMVQVGSSLITVPLTLSYLGKERFGLWMTVSSVLAMASFADFGVGNGVLNTVAKALGKDDLEAQRKAISSGFAILSSIAVFLLLLFFSIFRFVDWGNFFRVTSSQARLDAGPAIAVFATCFALNISVDVVQRVQLGLQQGYRYSMWQLCGSLLGFMGLLCGIWLHASLAALILALAGAPVLATCINAIHFFGFVRHDLRPSARLVSRETISQIARLGFLFFVLQVVSAISFSADNFIIARTLGAVNVPEYSIPQRLFAFITMISGMLVTPLWPAYGEAIARGHMSWVRHTLRKSLLLVLGASSIASFALLLLSPTLLRWWVGSRVHPTFLLLAGFATWTVLSCCGDALAAFLNGAEVIKFQMVVASLFGIGCVTTKILLIRTVGIVAIPWSTAFAYVVLNLLPYAIFLPMFMRKLASEFAIP